MAAITFPASPALNDIHTVGNRSWKYNGTAWKLVPKTTDAILEGSNNLYYTDARVAAAPAVTALETRAGNIESAATSLTSRVGTAEGTIAGLGTISTQDANAVNITGGTISGVSVNAASMEVGQGGTADLYVGLDGKVGIGTEAPTEKLTVNGHIDILSGRVKNLGAPVDVADAATKGYVDDTKQIKLVVSATAPAHVEGREWVDTTDFRRYLSVSGAWIEGVSN